MTRGRFSFHIDRLASWFNARGYEVRQSQPHEMPEPGIQGRIDYETHIVWVCTPDARQALMTLLHEAGHYMAERRAWLHETVQSPFWLTREFRAYQYGWYVRCLLEIDVITKHDWKDFHGPELALIKKGGRRFMLLDDDSPLLRAEPAPFAVTFDVPLRFLDPTGAF